MEPDPEPGDAFCGDSVRAVCAHCDVIDKPMDDREIEPYIRPHQVERDLAMRGVPLWCPLRKGKP
jgi:hypothetical protein